MPKEPPTKPLPRYGPVRSPAEVGSLCRAQRRLRGLTLNELYEATNLSTRFLSEFERGKENVSIGRVLRALQSLGLDVIVVPRQATEAVLRELHQRARES